MTNFNINNKKSRSHKQGLYAVFAVLLVFGLSGLWSSSVQAQCGTEISVIIADFNFNSETYACSGKGGGSSRPRFRADQYFYCPNVGGGSGDVFLGSSGHANTGFFNNAICLLNFYDIATASSSYGGTSNYDPNSSTFDPNSPANLYLDYTIPQGSGSCMDNFSVVPVQYMYDGSSVNFEKMGVAVFRNGFLIHTETQNIAASNVNGTPMSFDLSGSQFCADGSQEVNYQIVFGFVNQLVTGGALSPAQTGVDDIKLTGTYNIPSRVSGRIQLPSCLADGSPANNGKITIFGFKPSDKFDFTIGDSYTGSATYATATAIPADGILSTSLPNPAADTMYTVRVINEEDCIIDLVLKMFSFTCPTPVIPCDQPHSETIVAVDATCAGLLSNDDASISISGVVDGDKIGIFAGGPYAGPDYASADLLAAGANSYTALPNPVSNQIYTIRIFNGADDCYVDRTAEIFEFSCGPCSNASHEVIESGSLDPDSSPANSDQSEDDIAIYEACKVDGTIDLELSKAVSPTSGTTADTYVYTLILNNTGTMTATDIQITENFPFSVAPTTLTGTLGTYPDSLTIVASSASIGTFGLAQGWMLDSLQAGQSATLTIDVRAMIPGTYENCAYVTNMFPDNDPDSTDDNDDTANEDDDDCATITVTGQSLPTLVKEFSPMLTIPNTPTRLTLKITNTESTPITLSAALTDIFPTSPGQMVVAATPNLITNLSGITVNTGDVQVLIPSGTTLPPGLSQIQFDITVPAEGHYCNDVAPDDLMTSSGNNLLPTQACLAAYNAYVLAPVAGVTDICIDNAGDVDTLTLTIDNRNATPMTLDQDFINYLPAGVTMAAGSNTGTLTGVIPFMAGDTSFTLVTGSTIPSGVQTIIVPVTSATAGCYANIIYMNSILTTVGMVSNLGNQDIGEPIMPCVEPVIAARDTSICVGDTLNLLAHFSTTLGTLTYHSALPPTVGNELDTTLVVVGTDSIFYALATNGLCFDTLGVMVGVLTPDSLLVCEDGSDSVTITADPGFTNYQWYNEAGIMVGETNQTLTLTGTSSGLSDGGEQYYYTALDATGCPVSLCCPAYVATEMCCPNITNPIASQTTICEGETITTLQVTTDASTPDQIDFVYFSTQQTGNAMYTGGTSLGIVSPIVGVASISSVGLPAVGTYYVYGIVSPTPTDITCRPFQEMQIVVNALPNIALMLSDSTVCDQTAAVPILSSSEVGFNYQLRNDVDDSFVGVAVAGTGSPISFTIDNLTPAGTYTYNVLATNPTTGCSAEITDKAVITVTPCDFQDYLPTCENPPCHLIDTDIYLGGGVSSEASTSGSLAADMDDDDGILVPNNIRPSITVRFPTTIYNNTGNTAYLTGWVDWNGDQDFDDPGEQIANESYDYATYNGSFQVPIIVNVPSNAVQSQDIAVRYRLSTNPVSIVSPCGVSACATDGEIEDYLIQIECPPKVCLPVKVTINRN